MKYTVRPPSGRIRSSKIELWLIAFYNSTRFGLLLHQRHTYPTDLRIHMNPAPIRATGKKRMRESVVPHEFS